MPAPCWGWRSSPGPRSGSSAPSRWGGSGGRGARGRHAGNGGALPAREPFGGERVGVPSGRARAFSGAPEAFQRAILARDELGQYDLFRAAGREFVAEQPHEFLRLVLLKWRAFWWFGETAGLLYPRTWLGAYKTFYAGLLILSALGLVTAAAGLTPVRNRSGLRLVVLLCAIVAAAQSLYYVEVRHRWGIEPFLGIFAAAGVGSLAARIRPGGAAGDPLDAAGAAA